MFKKFPTSLKVILAVAVVAILLIGTYFIPPIHAKVAWRLDNLRLSIIYFFKPPQEVTFNPTEQALPSPTRMAFTPTGTPTSLPTNLPTPTITVTTTPPPESVILPHVVFIDQMNRYNYCGPANLAMALAYWGWKGTPGSTSALKDQVAEVVKPGEDDPSKTFIERGNTDVNVMPYELVDFVNEYTDFKALYRLGGDVDLLKRLIAAGFPAVTEKGIYEPLLPDYSIQWGGHYSFTTGYDDAAQEFIWQDSYLPPSKPVGRDTHTSYSEYATNWRAFDYTFIVVYPPDREQELFQVLGPWVDEYWAAQHALDIANQELMSLTLGGNDTYFAMFNKVSSLVSLQDPEYGPAAQAFDEANAYYNNQLLPLNDKRIPYRIMWYQTAPYKAYYYSGRFHDVIDLAKRNLQTIEMGGRELEESWYWLSRAEYELGFSEQAYEDMRKALHYHPGFQAALDMFSYWGIAP
jgi:hypothetical protein